jgi:hypothetical protein
MAESLSAEAIEDSTSHYAIENASNRPKSNEKSAKSFSQIAFDLVNRKFTQSFRIELIPQHRIITHINFRT